MELEYQQFEIFRSSAAYEEHMSENARDSFSDVIDGIDFEATEIFSVGKVSESVISSLAAMGVKNYPKSAGHVLLPGASDSDEECTMLISTFNAYSEVKGEEYIQAFRNITANMKPFASTYIQCKLPHDDVSFMEIMVFRNENTFENHFQSQAIAKRLRPTVRCKPSILF